VLVEDVFTALAHRRLGIRRGALQQLHQELSDEGLR
jgi:hypothetical protein